MARIYISTATFDVAGNAVLAALARQGYAIQQNTTQRPHPEAAIAALLREDVVGLLAGVEPLTRAVLAGAPALKVVSRVGIGTDNVDQAAARDLGIRVLNTPDAPTVPTAELTLGLILAALRRIAEADRTIRAGGWSQLMGGLLAGRTVGVVGHGRIGRHVSRLLLAFGCRVLAHDTLPVTPEAGVELVPLERLIAAADILTLHVPRSPGAPPVIGAAEIARMKPGAILVNAARGGLVDEAALLQALQSGHLAAAAIDAFVTEPYAGPLRDLPQVVLTAHMGSHAREARVRMEREAAENLLRALVEMGLAELRGHNT
ncbi:MAG: hydroxyacid dehydrogenase [Alphaproteobacteria bacterium]|nr:hydroxyacid dehydrogenase [Alphaproteobacteria bacterium]